MNRLEHIWIVAQKEFIDNLRDVRSLVSTLFSAMLTPAMLIALIMILGKTLFQEQMEAKMELPVVGAEYAPTLVNFLSQRGVTVIEAPADPVAAVRNGEVNVVLIIPSDYAEAFQAGQPATVELVMDSSRQSALADLQMMRGLLNNYGSFIGVLRLTARGVNPVITDALAVEYTDTATPQSQALIFIGMMPYFIVMTIFIGGLHVILDATAGERERSSLEPLLINPVRRSEFVLGKLFAAIPFALFTLIVNLVGFALAFNLVPLEDYLGFQISLDSGALFWIFIISLPMVLLATALQMIIATFSRGFKEAQTYTSFLPLIPSLPGIGLAFLPVKAAVWNMSIPTYGQQILINQFLRAETVNPSHVILSSVTTLVLAVIFILIAIYLFQRERVIFGAR